MTTAITVQHLHHAYGEQPVLENVGFEVATGSFFTIIGPNGSGKTTLMKLMAGILKCRRGSLAVFNRPAASFTSRQWARTIAFVPQAMPETFPFSVRELVLMGRTPHIGVFGLEGKADTALAEAAMQDTEIAHLAARKLNQISGGEQQRVFIARALCQDSKIILLDEPTAALDLAHQVRVMDLMQRLRHQRGLTVVMVSHDINLAAMYADRIMVLKAGRMVGLGTPRAVLVEDTLRRAYNCALHVDQSPVGDFPRISPMPSARRSKI